MNRLIFELTWLLCFFGSLTGKQRSKSGGQRERGFVLTHLRKDIVLRVHIIGEILTRMNTSICFYSLYGLKGSRIDEKKIAGC